jgi:heterodisulfide reductase subunit D
LAKNLPKVKDIDLYACLQCGYCCSVCPTYDLGGWESHSPRGKLFLLKQLSQETKGGKKKVKVDDRLFERMYYCTSCAACSEVCHVEIELAHMWEEVKEWLIKNKKFKPMTPHKVLCERISDPKKRNPFHDDNDPEKDLLKNRGKWLPDDVELSDKPEVVFFGGCTASYRLVVFSQNAVRLLHKAKVPFTILGEDEWCCGSPLLRTGQGEIIKKEFVKHNIDAIKKRGVKTVLTACAGCCNTLKHDYPKIYGKELPFKVYHMSEFMEDLIKKGRLKFTKPVNKKITFHDPCHLGRHARVFDAPREVIKAVPGVTLVEMPRTREESRCCGAGGGFKIAYGDLAEEIAVDRVKEAQETGAELIVTPCPFCVVNLNAGAAKADIPIKTMDLLQFVMMGLEE